MSKTIFDQLLDIVIAVRELPEEANRLSSWQLHSSNHRLCYNRSMKIVEAVTGMTRTYTFVFQPEPEGGFTVTCPALPGLVTYGETLDEARAMARDAMEGLIEIMLEKGERVPESDAADAAPRFHRLANTLQDEGEAEPIFEQLSAKITAGV